MHHGVVGALVLLSWMFVSCNPEKDEIRKEIEQIAQQEKKL